MDDQTNRELHVHLQRINNLEHELNALKQTLTAQFGVEFSEDCNCCFCRHQRKKAAREAWFVKTMNGEHSAVEPTDVES